MSAANFFKEIRKKLQFALTSVLAFFTYYTLITSIFVSFSVVLHFLMDSMSFEIMAMILGQKGLLYFLSAPVLSAVLVPLFAQFLSSHFKPILVSKEFKVLFEYDYPIVHNIIAGLTLGAVFWIFHAPDALTLLIQYPVIAHLFLGCTCVCIGLTFFNLKRSFHSSGLLYPWFQIAKENLLTWTSFRRQDHDSSGQSVDQQIQYQLSKLVDEIKHPSFPVEKLSQQIIETNTRICSPLNWSQLESVERKNLQLILHCTDKRIPPTLAVNLQFKDTLFKAQGLKLMVRISSDAQRYNPYWLMFRNVSTILCVGLLWELSYFLQWTISADLLFGIGVLVTYMLGYLVGNSLVDLVQLFSPGASNSQQRTQTENNKFRTQSILRWADTSIRMKGVHFLCSSALFLIALVSLPSADFWVLSFLVSMIPWDAMICRHTEMVLRSWCEDFSNDTLRDKLMKFRDRLFTKYELSTRADCYAARLLNANHKPIRTMPRRSGANIQEWFEDTESEENNTFCDGIKAFYEV